MIIIKSKKFLKVLAVVLCLSMIFSTLSMSASATENDVTVSRITVTVNGDTSSSRGLCWYTNVECDSVVKVYEGDTDVTESVTISNIICEEWEGLYMHKATVGGLKAGTRYTFSVGDGNVAEYGTFKTDNNDDSVEFIAIADVQASNDHSFQKAARVLNTAISYFPENDFIVNLGDFTNDSTNEEWEYYFNHFSNSNKTNTIVPVSGNHDGLGVWHWFENMFNLDTSESVQNLNGVNYSYDYGNAHFAVINTNDVLSVSNSQLKWLKNDLNSTDKDWKIVFMHKSPYSLGKDAKWPDALYLKNSLVKVLDECNVDMVMSGHDHMYLRTKALKNNEVNDDGAVYVLAGTAGSKRYEVRSFLANDFFLKKDFIDNLVIQEEGYANYWNGTDWLQTDENNVGGCVNIVSINGGELTLNSYIIRDTLDENGNDVITNIDTFTIEKEVGENEITFTGDNTTSTFEYALDVIPSFLSLAAYTFLDWLPKFLLTVPEIAYSYIAEGIF